MRRWISGMLLAIFALHSAGCATLIGTTQQQIQVHTYPPMPAHCGLANSKRSWRIANDIPLKVERDSSDLQITCVNQSYAGQAVGDYTVQPWTFLNLITGLLGLVGFGVDAATGAMFSYDNHITVPMQPRQSMAPSAVQPRLAPQPQGQMPHAGTMPHNAPHAVPHTTPSTTPDYSQRYQAQPRLNLLHSP
ncbi:MAG: hypothetical protein MRY32_01360 [Rickettsiales bacterium]|nr:hypothetical protein [Rickettsiales bacterium]